MDNKKGITIIIFKCKTFTTLTPTGRVFMWGNNENGQLGDGTITDQIVPKLI
jgi:alpha-tubulin suppressor-like RCC1 family protein